MRQTLLVASACGLAGGLAGGALVLWLGGQQGGAPASLPPQAAPAALTDAQGTLESTVEGDVLRRLQAVERRLAARGVAMPRAPAAAGASASEPAAPAVPVGDPVFEAAVLDVLERAEDERDSERSERRSERARQQAEHWAGELSERLVLSPQQAEKLAEIRARLQQELRDQSAANSGSFVPRTERRAARAALRERAEQELKDVLEPRQVARYEQLEGELRLARPPDAD